MKSTRNNEDSQPKRRLKTKPVLLVLGILLLGNLLWFIAWLIPNDKASETEEEEVASVDGKVITKEQWMASMEVDVWKRSFTRFGKCGSNGSSCREKQY